VLRVVNSTLVRSGEALRAHIPWWDVSGSACPELTCGSRRGLHLMQDARSPCRSTRSTAWPAVGHGYATACARALTQAGLALCDVVRVEVHTDEANAISAAIPRRLGYRLDRVDELPPEAPAHSGRLQIWVMERSGPEGQD
jgi:hypothetical protein